MQEDIKPRENSKMLMQGLIRAAGEPIQTSKIRVFIFTRFLSPKDTHLVANLYKILGCSKLSIQPF